MKQWWWLSFVLRGESQGIAIVQGDDFEDAVCRARALGVNPGGEVAGYPLDSGHPVAEQEMRDLGVNRLVPPAELRARGYAKSGDLSDELDGQVNDAGETFDEAMDKENSMMCEDHNRSH